MKLPPPLKSRQLGPFALLVGLVLAVGGAAYWACSGRTPPAPEPDASWATLENTRLRAELLEDGAVARRTFGFDIRGAGLLPVRLRLANRGPHPARLRPSAIFLNDGRDLAWPLLTADQARDRLAAARDAPAPPDPAIGARQWIAAAGVVTGFALDVFVGEAPAAAPIGRFGWLARLPCLGHTTPERQAGRDLASRFLRNPAVPAGGSAEGYLFFPGEDEVQGATALRVAVEEAGRVRVLALPLAPAGPSGGQPRPMAR